MANNASQGDGFFVPPSAPLQSRTCWRRYANRSGGIVQFSCKGIFKHTYEDPLRIAQYEERIVLIEADSFESGEQLVNQEFSEYSSEGIELVYAFEPHELYEESAAVLEVSSSMKVFPGTAEEYVEKFCSDLRPKSCEDLGWKHVWYNIGQQVSGCYNCQEEKNGRRWKNA